jgi:serine/threonine-protein kinase RsbW
LRWQRKCEAFAGIRFAKCCVGSSITGSSPSNVVRFRAREHAIHAELGRLREAREFAERAAADFGLDRDGRYEVKLALSEAITNAIQHGSSSPADVVRIAVAEEGGALVFEVVDSGHFVPSVMPRPEMADGGRGLEFMRLMMDEVDVRPGRGGTLLRLTKRAAA